MGYTNYIAEGRTANGATLCGKFMIRRQVVFVLLFISAVFGQTAKARKDYDKATIEIEHHNLARAEKLLQNAIADSPNWALAYAQLGHVYFLIPKAQQAIDAYEKARELDAKDHQLTADERHDLYDALGVGYGMEREYDKSIEVLQSAIKDDPDYGDYEYNLACTYSEKGDLDEALKHLQRAWELRNSFRFPDVTKDSSFKRWRNDSRFQEAAGKMVI
jgi:tetratricopeptide (TPR) repeat protein